MRDVICIVSCLFILFSTSIASYNEAYSFGANGVQALGQGQATPRKHNLTYVKMVASGDFHVNILTNSGSVYSFGSGIYGQLALGDTLDRNVATLVPGIFDAISISSTGHQPLIMTRNNSFYSCGRNDEGQTGRGDFVIQHNDLTRISAPLPLGVVKFCSGFKHNLILGNDSKVYGFGMNLYGQLGLGPGTPKINVPTILPGWNNVTDIGCGWYHSFLIANGVLYGMGSNDFGHLGLGDMINRFYPQMVMIPGIVLSAMGGDFHSLILTTSGIYTAGLNKNGQLGVGASVKNSTLPVFVGFSGVVKEIACGRGQNLILTDNLQLHVWGRNGNAQLGLLDLDDRFTPVLNVFSLRNRVTKINGGSFWSHIWNEIDIFFLAGNFGIEYAIPTPIVPLGGNALAVTGGQYGGMALRLDGVVMSFGYNNDGQLGTGETAINRCVPTPIKTGIQKISSGFSHNVLLAIDGTVWSSGQNSNGQLGTGNTVPSNLPVKMIGLPTIIDIDAGRYHTLLLTSKNKMMGVGNGGNGQLGGGTSSPTTPVELSWNLNIFAISAGAFHSIILSNDSYPYSFGQNSYGQLGIGSLTQQNFPTKITSLPNSTYITAGNSVTFVISNGFLYGLGLGLGLGQLGIGLLSNQQLPSLIAFFNGADIVKVANGVFSLHTLVLSRNGTVWGFGQNQIGALGTGNFINQVSPVMMPNTRSIIDIGAGNDFSVMVGSCPNGGFSGIDCSIPVCGGFSASYPNVCSGQGTCVAPNTCSCTAPSHGPNCEFEEFHWAVGDGDWSSATNWYIKIGNELKLTASAPSEGDLVYIDAPGSYSISVSDTTVEIGDLIAGNGLNSVTINIIRSSLTVSSDLQLPITSKMVVTDSTISLPFVLKKSGSLMGNIIVRGSTMSGMWQIDKVGILDVSQDNFVKCTISNEGMVTVRSSTFTSDVLSVLVNQGNVAMDNVDEPTIFPLNIENWSELHISGSKSTTLAQFIQSQPNSRLILLNSALNSPFMNITDGYLNLGGSITTSHLFVSSSQILSLNSPLTVIGNLTLTESVCLLLTLKPIDNTVLNVTESLVYDALMILQLADGFFPEVGRVIPYFTFREFHSSRRSVYLMAPYKSADYILGDTSGSLVVVSSFGSVSSIGYQCFYLGNRRVLEMNVFDRQKKAIVSLTTVLVQDMIGFGWDLNGTYNSSMLTISSANVTTQYIHPASQSAVTSSPPYIHAFTSRNPTIFAIGPYYQTINILVTLDTLADQKNIYYAEIANMSSSSRHYTEIYPLSMLNELKSGTQDSLCTNFLQPIRSEIYSLPGTVILLTIYVVLMILLVLFSRLKPLNTRGIAPYFTLIFLFIQLLVEIRNYFEIPTYQGSLCLYLGLGIYPIQVICFLMILFYFCRYFLIINMNESKNKIYRLLRDGTTSQFETWKVRIFKILTKPDVIIITFIISYIMIVLINLIIMSGYGFQCRFSTLLLLKTFHNIELILIYIATISTLVLDWITNHKIIMQFKWIQFITSDPHYYRIQILLFLPFMVFSLIVEIVSLASTVNYYGIVTYFRTNIALNTTVLLLLLLIEIVFPLALTIYLFIKNKLNFANKSASVTIDSILDHEDTELLFVAFCEREYTLEALACYQDIRKYKKENTNPLDIYMKYLNGGNSYMEINVSRKNVQIVFDKIRTAQLDKTLFDSVENEINANLYDVFSRFLLSQQYRAWSDERHKTNKMLENA